MMMLSKNAIKNMKVVVEPLSGGLSVQQLLK